MSDFRKKMSGSLSRGKKISCKEIPGKKIYLLALDAGKNLTQLYVGEKNYFSRGLGKKFFHPNQITHTSLKSQMVDL